MRSCGATVLAYHVDDRLLLEALGWGGSFDAIIGGDPLPVQKPDPEKLREAIA